MKIFRAFIAASLALVLAVEPITASGIVGAAPRGRPPLNVISFDAQAMSPRAMDGGFRFSFDGLRRLSAGMSRALSDSVRAQPKLSSAGSWVWRHRTAIFLTGYCSFLAVQVAAAWLGHHEALQWTNAIHFKAAGFTMLVSTRRLLCRQPASHEFKELTERLDQLVADAPREPIKPGGPPLTEEQAVDRIAQTGMSTAADFQAAREKIQAVLSAQTPLGGGEKINARIFFVQPPDGARLFSVRGKLGVIHYSAATESIFISAFAIEDLVLEAGVDDPDAAIQEIALHAWKHLTDPRRDSSRFRCDLEDKPEGKLLELAVQSEGEGLDAFSDKDRREIRKLTENVILQTRGRPKWLRPAYKEIMLGGEPDKARLEQEMLKISPTGWELRLTYYPYEMGRTAFNHPVRWGFNWVHAGAKKRIQIGSDLVVKFGYLSPSGMKALEDEFKQPIQEDNAEEPYLLTLLTIIRQPAVLRALLEHPEFNPAAHPENREVRSRAARNRAGLKGLARASIGEHYPSTVYLMRQRVISAEYGGSPVRIDSALIDKTILVLRELANDSLSLGERKEIPTWLQILVARAARAQKLMMDGFTVGWERLSVVYGRHLMELAAFLVRTVSYARLFGLIVRPNARRHLGRSLENTHDIAMIGEGPFTGLQALLAIQNTLADLPVKVSLDQFHFSVVDAVGAMIKIGRAAIAGQKTLSGKELDVTAHERNVLDGLPFEKESQDVAVTGLLGSLGDGMVKVSIGQDEVAMDRRVFLLAELNRVLRDQGYLQLLVRRKLPKEVRQALGRFGFTIITEPNARLFYSVWTLVRLLGKFAGVKIDRDRFDRLRSRFYGTAHLIAVKTGPTLSEKDLRVLAADASLMETLRKFSDVWEARLTKEGPEAEGEKSRRQPDEVHLDGLAFSAVSGKEADPTGITRDELAALMEPGKEFDGFNLWLGTLIWGQSEDPPYLTVNEVLRLNEFLETWDDSSEQTLPRDEVEWIRWRARAEARKPKPKADIPKPAPAPDSAKPFPPASPTPGEPSDDGKPKLVDVFRHELQYNPRLLERLLDPRTRGSADLGEPAADEPLIEPAVPEIGPEPAEPSELPAPPDEAPAAPTPPVVPEPSGPTITAPLSAADLMPLVTYLTDCLKEGRWLSPRWGRIQNDLATRGHSLPDDLVENSRDLQRVTDRHRGETAAYQVLYSWIAELNTSYLKESGFQLFHQEPNGLVRGSKAWTVELVSLARLEPIERYAIDGLHPGAEIVLYAARDSGMLDAAAINPLVHVVNDRAHRASADEVHRLLKQSRSPDLPPALNGLLAGARNWVVRAYSRLGFRPTMIARSERRQQRVRTLVAGLSDALAEQAYLAKTPEDSMRKGWDRVTPPYARWSPIPFMVNYLKQGVPLRLLFDWWEPFKDKPWAQAETSLHVFQRLNSLVLAADPAAEIARWELEKLRHTPPASEAEVEATLPEWFTVVLLVNELGGDMHSLGSWQNISEFLSANALRLRSASRQIVDDNFTVRLDIDRQERIHVLPTPVKPPPMPPAPPQTGAPPSDRTAAVSPVPPEVPPTSVPAVSRDEALAGLTDFVSGAFENGIFDEAAWRGVAERLTAAKIPFPGLQGHKTDAAAAFAREGWPLQRRYAVLYDWLEALNYTYLAPRGRLLVVQNQTHTPLGQTLGYTCRMLSIRTTPNDQYRLSVPAVVSPVPDQSLPHETVPLGVFYSVEHPAGLTPKTNGALGHFSNGTLIWGILEQLGNQLIDSRFKFWPELNSVAASPEEAGGSLKLISLWANRFSGREGSAGLVDKELERFRWSHLVGTIMGEQGKRLALAEPVNMLATPDPGQDAEARQGDFTAYWLKRYLDPQGFLATEVARLPADVRPTTAQLMNVYVYLSHLADGPYPAGKILEQVSMGLAAAEKDVKLERESILTLYMLGMYLNPSPHLDLAAMLKSGVPDYDMVARTAAQLHAMPDPLLRQAASELLDDSFRVRIRRGKGQDMLAEEATASPATRLPLSLFRQTAELLESALHRGYAKLDEWAPVLDHLRQRGLDALPLTEALRKIETPEEPRSLERQYDLFRLTRPLNDAWVGAFGRTVSFMLLDGKPAPDWTPALEQERPYIIEGLYGGRIPVYHFLRHSAITSVTPQINKHAGHGMMYSRWYVFDRVAKNLERVRKTGPVWLRAERSGSNPAAPKVAGAYRRWNRWLEKGYKTSTVSAAVYGAAYLDTEMGISLVSAAMDEWLGGWVASRTEKCRGLVERLDPNVPLDYPAILFVWGHLRDDSPLRSVVLDATDGAYPQHKTAYWLTLFYGLLNTVANDEVHARALSEFFIDIAVGTLNHQSYPISHSFRLLIYEMLQEQAGLLVPSLRQVTRDEWLTMAPDDPRWDQAGEEILRMKDGDIGKLAERILHKHFTAGVRVSVKDRTVRVVEFPEAGIGGGADRTPLLSERLRGIFIREYEELVDHWYYADQRSLMASLLDGEQRAHLLAGDDQNRRERLDLLRKIQESPLTESFAKELLAMKRRNIDEMDQIVRTTGGGWGRGPTNDVVLTQLIVHEQAFRYLAEAAQSELVSRRWMLSIPSDSSTPSDLVPLREAIQGMIELVHSQAPGLDPTLGRMYRDLLSECEGLSGKVQNGDFFDHRSDVWRLMIRAGVLAREQRLPRWKDGALNTAEEEAACRRILVQVRGLAEAAGVSDYDFYGLFGLEETADEKFAAAAAQAQWELRHVLSPEALVLATSEFVEDCLTGDLTGAHARELLRGLKLSVPLSDWTLQRAMHVLGFDQAPEPRILADEEVRRLHEELLQILDSPMRSQRLQAVDYSRLKGCLEGSFHETFPASVVEAAEAALAFKDRSLAANRALVAFILQLNEHYLGPLGYLIEPVHFIRGQKGPMGLAILRRVGDHQTLEVVGQGIQFSDYQIRYPDPDVSFLGSFSMMYGTAKDVQAARKTEGWRIDELQRLRKLYAKVRSNPAAWPELRRASEAADQLFNWKRKAFQKTESVEEISDRVQDAASLVMRANYVATRLGDQALAQGAQPLMQAPLQDLWDDIAPENRGTVAFWALNARGALAAMPALKAGPEVAAATERVANTSVMFFGMLQVLCDVSEPTKPSQFLANLFSQYFSFIATLKPRPLGPQEVALFFALSQILLKQPPANPEALDDPEQAYILLRQLSDILLTKDESELRDLGSRLLRRHFHMRLHFLPGNRIEVERFPEEPLTDHGPVPPPGAVSGLGSTEASGGRAGPHSITAPVKPVEDKLREAIRKRLDAVAHDLVDTRRLPDTAKAKFRKSAEQLGRPWTEDLSRWMTVLRAGGPDVLAEGMDDFMLAYNEAVFSPAGLLGEFRFHEKHAHFLLVPAEDMGPAEVRDEEAVWRIPRHQIRGTWYEDDVTFGTYSRPAGLTFDETRSIADAARQWEAVNRARAMRTEASFQNANETRREIIRMLSAIIDKAFPGVRSVSDYRKRLLRRHTMRTLANALVDTWVDRGWRGPEAYGAGPAPAATATLAEREEAFVRNILRPGTPLYRWCFDEPLTAAAMDSRAQRVSDVIGLFTLICTAPRHAAAGETPFASCLLHYLDTLMGALEHFTLHVSTDHILLTDLLFSELPGSNQGRYASADAKVRGEAMARRLEQFFAMDPDELGRRMDRILRENFNSFLEFPDDDHVILQRYGEELDGVSLAMRELRNILSPEVLGLVSPDFVMDCLSGDAAHARKLWQGLAIPLSDWTLQRVMHALGFEEAPSYRVLEPSEAERLGQQSEDVFRNDMPTGRLSEESYGRLSGIFQNVFNECFPASVIEAARFAMSDSAPESQRALALIHFVIALNSHYLGPLGYLLDPTVLANNPPKPHAYLYRVLQAPFVWRFADEPLLSRHYGVEPARDSTPSLSNHQSSAFGTAEEPARYSQMAATRRSQVPTMTTNARQTPTGPDDRAAIEAAKDALVWHRKAYRGIDSERGLVEAMSEATRRLVFALQASFLLGERALESDPPRLAAPILQQIFDTGGLAMQVPMSFSLKYAKDSLSLVSAFSDPTEGRLLGDILLETSLECFLFPYIQTMADMEQPSRLLEGRFDHYFKKMVNGQRTVLEGRDVKFFSALAKEVLGREAAPLDLMQDAALAADVIRQLAHALEHAKEADLKALGLKLLRRYFRIRLHFHADGRIEIERFPDDSAPDARRHPENSAA